MDHFQMGKSALDARQFFEAENHFRKALKTSSAEQKEEILANLSAVVKVTHPEEVWREITLWVREKAKKKNWRELLIDLADIEADIPLARRAFLHELRAEAFFHLGQYGEARKASSAHLEYLLRKKLIPSLIHFSSRYRERFPHTVLFYFHEVSAASAQHDFKSVLTAVKRLQEMIETRWHQLEDVTGNSKLILLSELVKTVESLESSNGEGVLLAHYCRLLFLRESKQKLEKDDWKKLTEILIFQQSWRNWKLALELSIIDGDEKLTEELHQRIKAKKGFSFVKFTRHEPSLKTWLLARGHNRIPGVVDSSMHVGLSDEDLQLSSELEERSTAQNLAGYLLDDEEQYAEDSALRQIRLNTPPLDMVPDLIVTYEMLGFGRVVDWLIATYQHSEEYPKVQKKIRYHSVLRDMKKSDHHHALATLEEMLGDIEITPDELKELKYAQAAIYHALGNKKRSQEIFAEVEAMEPGFRRLRERNW